MNAIMTDLDQYRTGQPRTESWKGFSEIDHAIQENRLTEYRIRKSWADPWARKLIVAVLLVTIAGFAYLAGASFGFW